MRQGASGMTKETLEEEVRMQRIHSSRVQTRARWPPDIYSPEMSGEEQVSSSHSRNQFAVDSGSTRHQPHESTGARAGPAVCIHAWHYLRKFREMFLKVQ